MNIKDILPPEYKITAINNTGVDTIRGKGRIFLMPDTPLKPLTSLMDVEIRPIPRKVGTRLIFKTLTANSWKDLKAVIRLLYILGYDFTTYTIQTLRNPIELVILKTPDGKMFINAVKQSQTPKRLVYYTSFPTTQLMLSLVIASNIKDTEGKEILNEIRGDTGKLITWFSIRLKDDDKDDNDG